MKDPQRLTSAFVAGLMLLGVSEVARAQTTATSRAIGTSQLAAFASGSVHGTVRDEAGAPVAGATVSALGGTNAVAVTDKSGRYEIRTLTPGSYLVRAHQSGFSASRTQVVQVRSSSRTAAYISMRRATPPTVLAAGFGLAPTSAAVQPDPDDVSEKGGNTPVDESELGWRIRHQSRTILKQASMAGDYAAGERWNNTSGRGSFLGAAESSARLAASFITAPTWSGEVNLLTSGTFVSPHEFLGADAARQVAHVSVSAPIGSAEWAVRGAITQSDISSWVIAGAYRERNPAGHRYELGMSYSTQRYDAGMPFTLRELVNSSRNVGEISAFDTVALSDNVTVNYGVRYARYDYLLWQNLFSPRVEVSVATSDKVRVIATVAHREHAPGAEEFLPPGDSGIWLPPQRTFSSLEPGRPMTAGQTTHLAGAVQRDLGRATVGIKAYHQRINHQLVTLFGTAVSNEDPIAKSGHYLVGSGGDATALGAGATLETAVSRQVRARFEYSLTRARLMPDESLRYVVLMAPAGFEGESEQIHNLSGAFEADLPQTATRLLVLYRVSNGFTQADSTPARGVSTRAVIDSRYDVQLRQALPFMSFSTAKWEMLVAVRNFFREPGADQSVYDELLVVHPPTRVLGGLTLVF